MAVFWGWGGAGTAQFGWVFATTACRARSFQFCRRSCLRVVIVEKTDRSPRKKSWDHPSPACRGSDLTGGSTAAGIPALQTVIRTPDGKPPTRTMLSGWSAVQNKKIHPPNQKTGRRRIGDWSTRAGSTLFGRCRAKPTLP